VQPSKRQKPWETDRGNIWGNIRQISLQIFFALVHPKMTRQAQDSSQIVDIADWELDEDFGLFPVGSRPKRAVFCPNPAPYPFLIGGHRYLFKVSKHWRIYQHWSEVIAYALAQLCRIEAAPSVVAIDSRANEVGALVEFFYGHPGSVVLPRLLSGADLLPNRTHVLKHFPGPPMTLGNMREQGMHHLIAFCLNDACRRQALIDCRIFVTHRRSLCRVEVTFPKVNG
jgi:hypothetical protein